MPTRTLLVLVLTLVGASSYAAPGDPTSPERTGDPRESNTRVLAIHPAQGAVHIASRVAAFAPDMRSVLGFSLRGERLWRVPSGDHGGARDLRVFGPNIVAYTGKEALTIAPENGQVLGRRDLVLPDPSTPTEGCELVHRGEGDASICALRCACSFELIRCDTLVTVGKTVTLTPLTPVGEGAQTRCPAYSGGLVGRSGDVLVASLPIASDTPFFGVAEEIAGVSLTSGDVLWRSRELGRFDAELSGVASDGRTCFVGSRAGTIQVFDCQRATLRWRRNISIVKTIEPQVLPYPDGLIVRDGKKLLALALGDGTPRWTKELANRTVAWPMSGGPRATWSSRPDTLALVAPHNGEVVASLPLPVGVVGPPLHNDDLWVVRGKTEIGVFDRHGLPLLTLPTRAGVTPLASEGALLVATPERLELYRLTDTFSARARFEGQLAKAQPIALDEPNKTIVLWRPGRSGWDPSDPETFGELHFLAFSP